MSSSQLPPAVQAMREMPARPQELDLTDLTQTQNTKNERSKILEYKATRPFAIREGAPYDLNLVAYEKFTNSTGANDQTTYNLSHNIIDADGVAAPLVLFQSGTAVSEDSIDYGADSFDYTDDGSGDPLDAYYVVADKARAVFRRKAPKNKHSDMMELDAGFANRRDQRKDPITFDFNHPVEAIVPKDYKLQVKVDSSFTIQWQDGTRTNATADNLHLSVPVTRANSPINGLPGAVGRTI